MSPGNKVDQDREWRSLRDSIDATLRQFGRKDAFGDGDFWILDDNWGRYRQEVEIQNLSLLQSHIVKLIQALLSAYPKWDVTVRVDVPDKRGEWPGMGLIISRDKIVDELQREYLPPEFRSTSYN